MASITVILPGYSAHVVGGYKVVYQYANYLVEQGHIVNIMHMRPAHSRDQGSRWWRRAQRAVQYLIGRHARPRWFRLDRRVLVTNYTHQFLAGIPKSDVIVATSMETAHFVARAAAERQIPGFYFIQGYEDWVHGSARVDETWRLPLRKIVIAPWLEQRAKELGVDAVLVRNAIDAAAFPPGAPIGERPLQVVALVSQEPLKRTDIVAKVFTRIAAEMPDVSLRTFGVIERPHILPDTVSHLQLPSPTQLRTLYQESRVYLCASDAEGWHLPASEAMSSGAAVVSTDIGGVRAYADGVALFSPVGDADLLAASALRFLQDEALCASRADTGQRRLHAYTPDQAAAAFERQLLRSIE